MTQPEYAADALEDCLFWKPNVNRALSNKDLEHDWVNRTQSYSVGVIGTTEFVRMHNYRVYFYVC